MLRVLLACLAVAVSVLVFDSCCCRSCSRNVTVPLGGGKSISLDQTGKSVSFTDEKGQTVTMDTDEGSGEFSMTAETEEGTTTITGSESEFVAVGPEGEESRWGSNVDQEVLDKLETPVFPGATGVASTLMPTVVTASFETEASYEDVVAFYEAELGEGWSKTTHSSDDIKSTSWFAEESSRVVTINGESGTQKVTFTLMRELKSE